MWETWLANYATNGPPVAPIVPIAGVDIAGVQVHKETVVGVIDSRGPKVTVRTLIVDAAAVVVIAREGE